MPLQKKTEEITVPDDAGGWYWLKFPMRDWQPIEVKPAGNNWPAHIIRNTQVVGVESVVKDHGGRWGPQIIPPKD